MIGHMHQNRKWTPKEKLAIVVEGVAVGSVSEICRKYGVRVNLYYEWKNKLLKSADVIFSRKKDGINKKRELKLEEELKKKDAVIAEIASENLELKRGRWV